MRTIQATKFVDIPKDGMCLFYARTHTHTHVYTHTHITVSLSVKSRVVTVKGIRGTLVKSFKHLSIEMAKVGKNRLRIDIWFANRKELACLNTVVGHIKNLFKGVLYVSDGV